MFAYNPQVNDRSGEIMAAGMMGAAQTRADSMNQMGQSIGGALESMGGTIGEAYEVKADRDSAYVALQQISKIFAPMAKVASGLEGLPPDVQGRVSQGLIGSMGALSQFAIAGMNNDARRQGQQGTTDRMFLAEQLRRERDLTNRPPQNNSTFTGGSKVRGLFNNQ